MIQHPLTYAFGVNLLDENVRIVKQNAESLRIAGKETGLGINAKRTVCVCVCVCVCVSALSTECRKN